MIDNIRIVCVETSHPGNLGAVARAMKNMGLSRLYLVNPRHFQHPDAYARAAGAVDILDRAILVEHLNDALTDCTLVMGSSARIRHIPLPTLSPRQAAEHIKQTPRSNEIAILFGAEQSGLSNEALQLCHYQINIPCDPDFSSLNLAAAVQLICYELYVALGKNTDNRSHSQDRTLLANMDEMEKFYTHLESTLIALAFLNPSEPKHLIDRLRRLFNRAQPDKTELNILRGILTAIGSKTNRDCTDENASKFV